MSAVTCHQHQVSPSSLCIRMSSSRPVLWGLRVAHALSSGNPRSLLYSILSFQAQLPITKPCDISSWIPHDYITLNSYFFQTNFPCRPIGLIHPVWWLGFTPLDTEEEGLFKVLSRLELVSETVCYKLFSFLLTWCDYLLQVPIIWLSSNGGLKYSDKQTLSPLSCFITAASKDSKMPC